MADYQVVSGFSLSGGSLGSVAVQKFSGIKIDVETSPTGAGNTVGGIRRLEPSPGPAKPGNPTFTVPITSGELPLAQWWVKLNPNAMQGQYLPEDLTFSFEGGNGVVAEWQLKGVFPMSYEVSEANATTAELAAETITLCVTEIVRMK